MILYFEPCPSANNVGLAEIARQKVMPNCKNATFLEVGIHFFEVVRCHFRRFLDPIQSAGNSGSAANLGADLSTSRSIGEPLSLEALQSNVGTAHVINAQPFAVGIAEIELAQIPAQMHVADVLIDAIEPAFQDAEIALDGIGVEHAAHVLLPRVVDGAVSAEIPADIVVGHAFIGEEERLRISMSRDGGMRQAGELLE